MKQFFKDMTERAVKTAAQSAIAIMSTAQILSEINLTHCLSAVAVATILSILMSLSSFHFGEKGTACAVKIGKEEES
ncbi:MAG: holin [Oscillospiraceae bacterium]|nr:holin [Oscillospiraceae bacterium]